LIDSGEEQVIRILKIIGPMLLIIILILSLILLIEGFSVLAQEEDDQREEVDGFSAMVCCIAPILIALMVCVLLAQFT
jgi:hypothetical protein